MASGLCPKCNGVVSRVMLEGVTINAPGASWHGVNYLCPLCRTVLSVGIEPVALKTDIVSEVVEKLRKGH